MKKIHHAFTVIAFSFLFTPAFADQEKIVVAGGCFWCVEANLEDIPGVVNAVSGYTGGSTANPNYNTYHDGNHYEAVEITYENTEISRADLYKYFLRSTDVADSGGQFCDRGQGYATAIFVKSQAEANDAQSALSWAQSVLSEKVVTPILKGSTFYPAEDYHQNYAKRAPLKYKYYRTRCGRDKRVKALWGQNAFATNH